VAAWRSPRSIIISTRLWVISCAITGTSNVPSFRSLRSLYFTTPLSDRLNQRCLCGGRFRQLVRGLGRPPIYELSVAAARNIAWRPSVTLTLKPAGLAHCSVVCCPVRQFASRKPKQSAPGALPGQARLVTVPSYAHPQYWGVSQDRRRVIRFAFGGGWTS
jgi:hypothetical protein